MSYLFIVEDNIVKPTVEVLRISPFREIWERDNSDKKEVAYAEFAYIENMTSWKKTNPYYGYGEQESREPAVIRDLPLENWKADRLVKSGLDYLKKYQLKAYPSLQYLKDARGALDNMSNFFRTVDYTEVLKSGAPKYKPADVTKAVKESRGLLKTIQGLEDDVKEEMLEEKRIGSDKEISPFAM